MEIEGNQTVAEPNTNTSSRTTKVLVLSLGQTLITLASIVSGMVAARVLSKHDYATMKQTMLAYSFAAPILMLGLPNALYYFLPRENVRKKGLVIDNLFLLMLLALIFSVFLMFGGYRLLAMRFSNPDLSTTLKWMILYPLYVMPASILGAVLMTQNRTMTLAKYNVISSLLTVGLTIAGVLITKSYTGPLLVQIFFPLALFPVVLFLIFKYVPGYFSMPNRQSMIAMIKFAVPLGLASMLSMIMLETNKFIVSAMCTPEEFANYVNGAIEIPLIGVITGSISSVILVDMTEFIKKGDRMSALNLFRTAATRSASVLLPVMVFLLVLCKPFIVTLYSEKYLESIIPFVIYLFILPIRIVFYGSALIAMGKSKIILVRSFFDLLINSLLSIILIKFFGYLGAALATILTLYIWTVPYNLIKIGNWFNLKAWNVLPLKEILKILIISMISLPPCLVYIFFNHLNYFIQLLIAAIIYFPIVGIFLFKQELLVLPDDINKILPSFIKRKARND